MMTGQVTNVRKERLLYRLSWVLLLLVIFTAVFGSWLMPHYISSEDKIFLYDKIVDGVARKSQPPIEPNGTFWLGTDHRGYDLLSLILNGAKYTMGLALAVTALRFVIALPIGLLSGVTGTGRSLVQGLQVMTSAVPPLLILFPSMYALSGVLLINTGLPSDDPRLALFTNILFAMMVVIGIFPLAQQFSERAQFYAQKEYVSVARTIGASHTRIIGKHLMPHLRPELMFAFLTEFIQVLFLMGQLAVMSIFIGGGESFEVETERFIQLTTSGEWGGLISYGMIYIRNYWWLILFPTLFFVSSILILQFFSSRLQKRLANPAIYATGPVWKRKPVLVAVLAGAAACVVLVTLTPNKAPVAVMAEVSADKAKLLEQGGIPGMNGNGPSPQTDKIVKSVTERSQMFMKYIAEGKWEYAEALLDYGFASDIGQDARKPPEPFDQWYEALTTQGFHFIDIGEPKLITASQVRLYEVDVHVTDSNNQPQTWYLAVRGDSSPRIQGGKGTP